VTESVLPNACAWAKHGHGVFPLWWPITHDGQTVCACGRLCGKQAAKHPVARYAPNGHLSASVEPGVIKLWWELRVPEANLGVRTEKLVVIDIDPRHGGDESFAVLEREHGAMPLTWQVLTGGGGQHIIYGCPDGVAISSFTAENMDNPPLGPGIDVRAKGGYIVAPPSRHISGRSYAWSVDHHPHNVPLASAPDWLIGRLVERATSERRDATPPEVWQRLTGTINENEYPDAAAAQVAGHLLRRWVDPYLVAGLLHAWNQIYVRPPLPEDELRRILDRIAKREDRRRDAAQGGEHGEA
jgi:hypothetical protein